MVTQGIANPFNAGSSPVAHSKIRRYKISSLRENCMYRDPRIPDIAVEVFSVAHLPKCARCYKHLEGVDSDPVFAMICHGCASLMHTFFYDIEHGYHKRLPINLTRDVDEFIQTYVRPELRNLTWTLIDEKFNDFGIPNHYRL